MYLKIIPEYIELKEKKTKIYSSWIKYTDWRNWKQKKRNQKKN